LANRPLLPQSAKTCPFGERPPTDLPMARHVKTCRVDQVSAQAALRSALSDIGGPAVRRAGFRDQGDLGFFKARHLEAFFKRAEAVLIADCYEDAPLAGGRAELDNRYADMCTADTLAASRPFGDRSAWVFSLRPALSVTLG
jgi:hypothetical protein